MREFPAGGLFGRIQRLARQFSALRISVHASSASYFLALSVFPALLLILSLLRYLPLPPRALLEALAGFLPEALLPYAEELILGIYGGASPGLVSVSALTALWSASRGVQGLMNGLCAVYGRSDGRGYFRARLHSLGYTFAFLAVLILTLVLHVFGTALVDALRQEAHPFIRFLAGLIDLRFFLLLLLQTALFAAMFSAVNRQGMSREIPGALAASLGWLVFSNLFSLYIDYFGDSTQIYGSVYTVALSMLWLYICVSIVFYGGALNRFFSRRDERKK